MAYSRAAAALFVVLLVCVLLRRVRSLCNASLPVGEVFANRRAVLVGDCVVLCLAAVAVFYVGV